MKPITVGTDTYTSISSAWRQINPPISLVTLRWRLKNGWHIEDAFFHGVVPATIRRTFKEYRAIM